MFPLQNSEHCAIIIKSSGTTDNWKQLVLMTLRVHPFPCRTRKLSSMVPKILGWWRPGKIGRCQHKPKAIAQKRAVAFLRQAASAEPALPIVESLVSCPIPPSQAIKACFGLTSSRHVTFLCYEVAKHIHCTLYSMIFYHNLIYSNS